MQDNEGHFKVFCKTVLTLSEGQCRTISKKKKKKITKNTGEYRVQVHKPIKNKSNLTLYS